MNRTELYKIIAGLDETLVERADNAPDPAAARPEAGAPLRRNAIRPVNTTRLTLASACALALIFTLAASFVAAALLRKGNTLPGPVANTTPVTLEYSKIAINGDGKEIKGPEGYFLELEFPAVIENNERNDFEFTFLAGFDEVIYANYLELLGQLPEDEQPRILLTFDSLDNHAYDTSAAESDGFDPGYSVHCELEGLNLETHSNDTVLFSGKTTHDVTFAANELNEKFCFDPGTEWTESRIPLPYSLNVSATLPKLADGDCGWIIAWLHEDGIGAQDFREFYLTASFNEKKFFRINHLAQIFYYCTGDYIGFGPNIDRAYANAMHRVEWYDPYTVVDETTRTYRSNYQFREEPFIPSHAPAPTVNSDVTPEPTFIP